MSVSAAVVIEEDQDLAGLRLAKAASTAQAGEIPDDRVSLRKAGESGGQGIERMLCIKRRVVIAAKAVKFLFAPRKGSPCIAMIVLEAREGKAQKDL